MSFTDSAEEVLDRAEASLRSLITDALKAKAYSEIAAIAALAASVGAERSREGTSTTVEAPTSRASEPS